MVEEENTRTIRIQPSIKLIKLSKGYNWEIKASGEDMAEVKKIIDTTDKNMRETYGK